MQPQADEYLSRVDWKKTKEQPSQLKAQQQQQGSNRREGGTKETQIVSPAIFKRKGSRTTLLKEVMSAPPAKSKKLKEPADKATPTQKSTKVGPPAAKEEITIDQSTNIMSTTTDQQPQQQQERGQQEESPTPNSSPNLSATLGRLAALSTPFPNSDQEIVRLGKFLNRGSAAGLLIWAVTVGLVLLFSPADSYERLHGPERSVTVLVWVLLFVTNGSRMLPLLFRDFTQILRTGVIAAVCSVQLITLTTVGSLIIFPTPVLIDKVTNRRVLMLRWAAWVPLSFLMTFLTEGVDLPNNKAQQAKAAKIAWAHALAIALSAAAGLIFPLCQTFTTWIVTFTISCILFSSLFIRLYQRFRRLQQTPMGQSVEEQEHYDQVRLSFRLLGACASMWTALVLCFSFCCAAHFYPKHATFWTNPAMPTVIESIFEIGSKVWYLILVIDIHEVVFDESSRAVRRLEEMRDMMNVVWESSSDIIALCVRTDDTIHAVVSPTFLSVFHDPNNDDNINSELGGLLPPADLLGDAADQARDFVAIVFEIPINKATQQEHRVFALNMNEPFKRFDLAENERLLDFYIDRSPNSVDQRNIASMVELFRDAWNHTEKESLVIQGLEGKVGFVANDGLDVSTSSRISLENSSSSSRQPLPTSQKDAIQFEAKITKLEGDAVVIVLRDISDRFQRFEAEKQLIIEMTERKKDAEANRFTRHEVKNGLLAAIGLVDTLKESLGTDMSSLRASVSSTGGSNSAGGDGAGEPLRSSFRNKKTQVKAPSTRTILELDQTLHEVLDTVMAEAMARDVVHGVYESKAEEVDVRQVLARRETANEVRFPFLVNPNPFPRLLLDPQLLRYVHRNAVSNAIKFGRSGGVVSTDIHYDSIREELRVTVINEPGRGHNRLLELPPVEVNKIFLAGTRLEANSDGIESEEGSFVSSSAGDGAWIMQKCARVMGGHCFIKFEDHRTIFSLYCPSKTWSKVPDVINVTEVATIFALPTNTWGVAIDDSGIQRKLLERFLALAGVTEQRRIVLGSNSKEVLGFSDFLGNLIRENPQDKFLVIVDENLDILDGGMHQQTVSGSMCIKVLQEELAKVDEERLLALVRSANDSSEDVTLYKERAHGFLPKAPIQKDKVLDLIEPWWNDRFPNDTSARVKIDPDYDSEFLTFAISLEDLMETIEVVDDRISESTEDEATLKQNWPGIREKLHILKGDLKTMKQTSLVRKIIVNMEQLRSEKVPDDLSMRWTKIRNLIISMRC